MYPKTMRQQNTHHEGNRQAASKWTQSGRSHSPPSTTEYQDKFLHPNCYKAVISTSTQKNPHHALKGTRYDVSTFRLCYVTNKWIKNPPKESQPPVQPKCHQTCSSAPDNPAKSSTSHTEPKSDAFITMYKKDFQAWKITKWPSCKLTDSLKVNQGLVVPLGASEEVYPKKRSVQVAANSKGAPHVQKQPFEGITSYRNDFVCHPVQPRTCRKKPAHQPNKGVSFEHAVFVRSEMTRATNQEPLDEAREFFQEFMTLENKFQSQVKAKESSPPADHKFFSTTHADNMAHKWKPTTPVLPSMQKTATMEGDYKAWNTPRRLPTVSKKELNQPGKSNASAHTPKPADRRKTKPLGLHPKLSETTASNANSNTNEKPQYPDENGIFSGFDSPPGPKNPGDTKPPHDRATTYVTMSFGAIRGSPSHSLDGF